MALNFRPAPKGRRPFKSSGAAHMLREAEAAERLRVSRFTLARYRKNGEIAATELGSRFYYSEAAITEYIERKTIKPCLSQKAAFKSGNTISPAMSAPPCGKQPGSTKAPDKQSASLLAQATFGKPKSA